MAVTMLQYDAISSPLGEARPSVKIKFPPGAHGFSVYVVASQGLYSNPDFRATIKYQLSDDGTTWDDRKIEPGNGGEGFVAPRAVGMNAGEIPASLDVNYEFEPGDAIALGSERVNDYANSQWIRVHMTPLSGTNGGARVAAVLEVWDIDGNTLEIDTSTRAA